MNLLEILRESGERDMMMGVRKWLSILPIIGMVDPLRVRRLTERLLRGIRTNRARVVVMDITSVPAMDATVANHLVLTVEAARLLGATVIVAGLSPEVAQTLVNIGVDLSKMNTVADLQDGIEEAERLLGYKVVLPKEVTPEIDGTRSFRSLALRKRRLRADVSLSERRSSASKNTTTRS